MIGGVMVVPLLLSAIVHGTGLTQLPPPPWLVALVQVIIGCVAGSRFAGVQWHEVRTSVVRDSVDGDHAAGGPRRGRPVLDIRRCIRARPPTRLRPGGIAEMTIVAFAMGIEVAFVFAATSSDPSSSSRWRRLVSPDAQELMDQEDLGDRKLHIVQDFGSAR